MSRRNSERIPSRTFTSTHNATTSKSDELPSSLLGSDRLFQTLSKKPKWYSESQLDDIAKGYSDHPILIQAVILPVLPEIELPSIYYPEENAERKVKQSLSP